ncbi:MAG: hypothetical protein LBS96_04780 [Oscillospiraceae bacterium]|jgi:hypothetical protein|nr:hypothetical protein [Oscillospiraceae bacterium]
MQLRLLADSVLDAAADAHTFGYAVRDTKAVDAAFASFFFCDWETLESRRVPEAVYMQLKFGGCAAAAAAWLAQPLRCKAAILPDGGCAALEPAGGMLHLFRPGGDHASSFTLCYADVAAHDLVAQEDSLWFTVPERGALARFSLNQRELTLRAGGNGIFRLPRGITRNADTLWVCCAGSNEAKAFSLTELEVTETLELPAPPEKIFRVYSRMFALLADGRLHVTSNK